MDMLGNGFNLFGADMVDHIFKEDKNGKLQFIGDFDALYRDDPDPWGQSGEADDDRTEFYVQSMRNVCDLIGEDIPQAFQAIDIGCGLGFSTAGYRDVLGGRWTGCDISMEAITRARSLWRTSNFFPVDIAHRPWPFLGSERGRYHVAIWSHLFWYVMDRLAPALENSLGLLRPGGILFINQAVMRDEQRYGRELADGHEGIVSLVADTVRGAGGRLISASYRPGMPWMDQTLLIIGKDGDK